MHFDIHLFGCLYNYNQDLSCENQALTLVFVRIALEYMLVYFDISKAKQGKFIYVAISHSKAKAKHYS